VEIAVKKIRTFLSVAAVTAALTLSACGSATTSSTSTSPEPSVSREAAPIPLMGSFSHYFAVENQLTGIPVTWKVSETVNRDWDGNSRPDHRPPDGLQGLVQEPFSGSYKVRLEMNERTLGQTRFVLTPVALVEGEIAELESIEFIGIPVRMTTAGNVCEVPMDGGITPVTASLSKNLKGGLLVYEVVMDCNYRANGAWNVLLRFKNR
jgi:hypothetical protein